MDDRNRAAGDVTARRGNRLHCLGKRNRPGVDMDTIWLVLEILVAYALGSVSGALWVGRFRGIDIRRSGSGNPGTANAVRVLGVRWALVVLAIDILKGALATGVVPLPGNAAPPAVLACALAAVAGHMWPVWHGFRGGKGIATAFGAWLCILPMALVPVAAVWLAAVVLTGYTSLGALLASAGLVVAAAWFAPAGQPGLYAGAALALAALVWFAHRANIRRLWLGRENRFEALRVFHRRTGP